MLPNSKREARFYEVGPAVEVGPSKGGGSPPNRSLEGHEFGTPPRPLHAGGQQEGQHESGGQHDSRGQHAVGARLPAFVGASARDAAARLAACRLVIVGLGSVGRRIALHLARLGCLHTLWLVDPGHFDDPANLTTQAIGPGDLGQSKAASTGRMCKAISPTTRVFTYEGRIQDLDPVLMVSADGVCLASDNLAAEVDVASRFRLLGIPVLQAAVHGETLLLQIRFTVNASPVDPCLICAYGPLDWQHLNQSSVFRCGGAAAVPDERIREIPTMSTSFLCSLAANFAVVQWIRHTLGLGAPVGNTILQYCAFTHRSTQTPLTLNQKCKGHHLVLERREIDRQVSVYTPHQLAAAAGLDPHGAGGSMALTLGHLAYAESAVCRCGPASWKRWFAEDEALDRCTVCQTERRSEPFFTHRTASRSVLGDGWDTPLCDRGARDVPWAVVSAGERAVLLQKTHET